MPLATPKLMQPKEKYNGKDFRTEKVNGVVQLEVILSYFRTLNKIIRYVNTLLAFFSGS